MLLFAASVGKIRVRNSRPLRWPILLIASAALMTGCGSDPKPSSQDAPPPTQPTYPPAPPVPVTWSPQSSDLPAPTAQVPAPKPSTDFPLTISSPTDSSTVTSPINVVASAQPKNPIFFMRVYVDQLAVYFTFDNSIDTQIFVTPGQHTIEVMAEDNQGYISATPISITVSSQPQQTAISGIQNMPGWQACGALFPPGSGRAGQVCAAGFGTPSSTMTQNVSSPSMDGKSAEFSIGPQPPDCPGYCNMLYFNPVAGGNNVSHFIYDIYFQIDNPDAPQALEFDLNQTYGGQRWVWGSECNFKGDGHWDIWDDSPHTGWEETNVPCTSSQFPANTSNHITWDVQQAGANVQYNTLTINGTVYQVNMTYPNQQNWTLEEIDTAFQMDLDEPGTPYHIWLDKVTLTAQ
jgi:hypothetical protein